MASSNARLLSSQGRSALVLWHPVVNIKSTDGTLYRCKAQSCFQETQFYNPQPAMIMSAWDALTPHRLTGGSISHDLRSDQNQQRCITFW